MKTLNECIQMRRDVVNCFIKAFPQHASKLDIVLNCNIIFNPRMRTTAGRVKYRTNELFLNTRLLNMYPEEFDSTFIHELSHLISYHVFNKSGHDNY